MVSFDTDTIGYINLFEKITQAKLKDCFKEEGKIIFVVYPGEVGKAVGKKGANVKRLSSMIKRDITIIEFDPDPVNFVKNLIRPVQAEVNIEDDNIIIKSLSTRDKGQIMGRGRSRLEKIQSLTKKYFKLGVNVV